MKEFKGTPGPWFVGDELKVFTDEGRYICRQSVGLPDEKAEANAHLIAAAPELLETLQQCIPHLREQSKNDGHAFGTLQLVNRIIAKALGETK